MLIKKSSIIKKEYSKKDFIDAFVNEIGNYNDIPIDIGNLEIIKVEEKYVGGYLCKGQVKGEITASIGYNKLEYYWDKVLRHNDNNEPFYEEVKRSRTVTDWNPFSCNIDKTIDSSFYYIDGEFYSDFSILINDVNKAGFFENGPVEIDESIIDDAKSELAGEALARVDLPGDSQRDIHHDFYVELLDMEYIQIPRYDLTYRYNNELYTAGCYAIGEKLYVSIGKYPKRKFNNIMNDVKFNNNVNKEFAPYDTNTSKYQLGTIGILLAYIPCAIALGVFMPIWVKVILFIIGSILLLFGIYSSVKLGKINSKRNEIINKYRAIFQKTDEQKKLESIKLLKEKYNVE